MTFGYGLIILVVAIAGYLVYAYNALVTNKNLVAEGWITRRGRSILFCQAEVRAVDTGEVVAEGWMTYKVSAPRTGATTNGAT